MSKWNVRHNNVGSFQPFCFQDNVIHNNQSALVEKTKKNCITCFSCFVLFLLFFYKMLPDGIITFPVFSKLPMLYHTFKSSVDCIFQTSFSQITVIYTLNRFWQVQGYESGNGKCRSVLRLVTLHFFSRTILPSHAVKLYSHYNARFSPRSSSTTFKALPLMTKT